MVSWMIKLSLLLEECRGYIHLNIGKDLSSSELIKRDFKSKALDSVAIKNSVSYYETNLNIGTPPQLVTVQVDTGSSDLWVISKGNPFCESGGCSPGSTFDASKSKTFTSNDSLLPFEIAYGDSTFAKGVYGQDRVMLLGTDDAASASAVSAAEAGVSSKGHHHNFPIIQNTNLAIADVANSTEAVLGVGMVSAESMASHTDSHGEMYPTYANLPMQMKQQGYIDAIAYSLWLNDLHAAKGSLLFGAVDHTKYTGKMQKVPMINPYKSAHKPIDFSIMMHGISAYNKDQTTAPLAKCSVPVLLDSGTTYSYLPSELLNPILEAFGAVFDDTNGVYLVSESHKKYLEGGGIEFNFSGIKIDIGVEELLIPVGPLKDTKMRGFKRLKSNYFTKDGIVHLPPDFASDEVTIFEDTSSDDARDLENYYVLGILPTGNEFNGAYILGDTFLRSAYVVYDLENKEIALANTNFNGTSPQIDRIDTDGIPSARPASWYLDTQISPEVRTYDAAQFFLPSATQTGSFHYSLNTAEPLSLPSSKPIGSLGTLTEILSRPADSTTTKSADSTHKILNGSTSAANGGNAPCALKMCAKIMLIAILFPILLFL